jgi:hypothetical protein
MNENGKMRTVQTILGMGTGRIKNDGGGEFNYDICKNFGNVTMYPQYDNDNKK